MSYTFFPTLYFKTGCNNDSNGYILDDWHFIILSLLVYVFAMLNLLDFQWVLTICLFFSIKVKMVANTEMFNFSSSDSLKSG